ncbi:hypothetical protein M3231_15380 [Neobacillus mesonae]|nr:hypothetical protein [Neobacillus mesonae]
MSFEKLNSAANSYAANESEVTLRDFYDAAVEALGRIHVMEVIRSGRGDESDAMSIFHDKFLKLSKTHAHKKEFAKLFSRSLRNARFNFYKKVATYHKYFGLELDNEDIAPTIPIPSNESAEDEIMSEFIKNEGDQMIAHLIDPRQVDAQTMELVNAYLTAPPRASKKQIAKSVGLHHEVANRKLLKLAHRYDANRFGDIQQYLAV